MGNLKVFWGADHKVGTTMLAQSYAEKLTEQNKEVLMLSVCTNPGDDFYDEYAFGIEDLRTRLSCSLLTKENIREYANKGEVFYKLNGLSSIGKMYGFTPDMAFELIRIASEAFDEVIVDCGTGLDNPLTIAALTYDRNLVFIFSQQESSLRSWQLLSEKMSKLGVVPRIAVINKFFKGDKYSLSYISQRTGLPQSIFKTVAENEFGIQAESDRKTLLFYGDKQYEKDIKTLVN